MNLSQIFKKKIYDPLATKYVRDLKPTDILNVASSSTNGSTGDVVLSNTVIGAKYDAYLHTFIVGSSTDAIIALVVDGTTKLYTRYYEDGDEIGLLQAQTKVALLRVAGGSTFSVVVVGTTSTGNSYYLSSVFNREPNVAALEP